jgi:hypothetical protein
MRWTRGIVAGSSRLSRRTPMIRNLFTGEETLGIEAEVLTYHCCQFCGGFVTEHVHGAENFEECERRSPPVCSECWRRVAQTREATLHHVTSASPRIERRRTELPQPT